MLHASASAGTGVCRCCNNVVTAVGGSPWWKVAVVAGYAVETCMLVLLSALGPHMALSTPVWMFCFLGVMGPLHAKAAEDALCPSCGKVFEARETPALEGAVAPARM